MHEKITVIMLGIVISLIGFSWKQESDARKELLVTVIQLRVDQAAHQERVDSVIQQVKYITDRVNSLEYSLTPKLESLTNRLDAAFGKGVYDENRTPVFGRQ